MGLTVLWRGIIQGRDVRGPQRVGIRRSLGVSAVGQRLEGAA